MSRPHMKIACRQTGFPLLISWILFFCLQTYVLAEQQVRVGVYENHPKIFTDADGKVSGFWPELIEHIAGQENWKIEYVPGTWSEGLNRLKSNQIDIMPDVAFTEKRGSLYAFSESPVIMSWSRVYTHRENNTILSIQDLGGKKIAALKGSVNLDGEDGFKEIISNFNLHCIFVELDNYTEVFKAIEGEKVDAGITNRNFGNKKSKDFLVKKTPIIFQPINMKFAFPQSCESAGHFQSRVNVQMRALLDDETSVYYRLLEKYFEGEIAERRVTIFPEWLKSALQGVEIKSKSYRSREADPHIQP